MAKKQIYMTDFDFKRLRGILQSLKESGRVRGSSLDALEKELDRASVVPQSMIPEAVVTMNSTVRFTDLITGRKETYTLVFPGLADASKNTVSILAPLGAALIGEMEGSEVEYAAPGGSMRLRVDEVVYQPEKEGAFSL